jgi:potassium-dependent mechanosensitive channel
LAPEFPEEASEALQGLTWQRGLIALVVVLGFFLVATLTGRLIRRHLSARAGGGPIFALSKLITYVVGVIGVVTGLNLLGVPLSSLLLTSSALLVGIGFSLQNVTQDFIAGIILLVEQPIRKDDFITFGATAGSVQEIGLRATHLLTVDGTDLIVPNHLLVTAEVYNHSYPLKRARLNVDVAVSLLEDVERVAKTLSSTARSHSQVLTEPPPITRLEAITDSHFQFALIVWVADPSSTVRVASELRFAVAQEFARCGVRYPTPELLLHTLSRAPRARDPAQIAQERPDPPEPR